MKIKLKLKEFEDIVKISTPVPIYVENKRYELFLKYDNYSALFNPARMIDLCGTRIEVDENTYANAYSHRLELEDDCYMDLKISDWMIAEKNRGNKNV